MAQGGLVVFLHGAVLGPAMWTRQAAALPPGWRSIALTLPGHGSRRQSRFTLDAARDDVLEALHVDGAENAVLVGVSLGGYVAMSVATAAPDRVRALVLSGCSAPARAHRGPVQWAGRLLAALPERTADRIVRWLIRAATPKEIRDPALISDVHGAVYLDAVRELANSTVVEDIVGFERPVLLLDGEHDSTSRRHSRALLPTLARGEAIHVPGVGHMCFTTAFSQQLTAFLRQLD